MKKQNKIHMVIDIYLMPWQDINTTLDSVCDLIRVASSRRFFYLNNLLPEKIKYEDT